MTGKWKLIVLFLMLGFICPLTASSLKEKAEKFDTLVSQSHMPLGLVVNLLPSNGSGEKFSSTADSTIWTGAYIASQVYRYKVTQDSAALDNVEKCLRAFVTLHKMAGSQGFMGRCFGWPEQFAGRRGMAQGVGSFSHLVFRADTSRDQYTGIFLGCGAAWPLIRDQQLKIDVGEMLENAGLNLVRNNLALTAKIGSETIVPFNLNPDYAYQDRIKPEEWAKVDDFPVNVFAQSVPYSDRLASVIADFRPPPVRGGEALRALMMLETAAKISGNSEIERFLSQELLIRRDLAKTASDTCLMLSDVFYGRNSQNVEVKLEGVLLAFLKVAYHALNLYSRIPESITRWCEPVAMVFLNHFALESSMKILRTFDYLRGPDGFGLMLVAAERVEAIAQQLDWMKIKSRKLTKKLKDLSQKLRGFGNSNVDQFADTMRSYVGCNLTYLALLGILENGSIPEIKSAAQAILPRAFTNIADEKNSLYTFITAAFAKVSPAPEFMASALETMRLYPENQQERKFDHRKDPNLTISPWPDRFGRMGGQCTELIPINLRSPHIFIWQESPRNLRTGSNSGRKIAPVGYLLAYWFARFHEFIGEND